MPQEDILAVKREKLSRIMPKRSRTALMSLRVRPYGSPEG